MHEGEKFNALTQTQNKEKRQDREEIKIRNEQVRRKSAFGGGKLIGLCGEIMIVSSGGGGR